MTLEPYQYRDPGQVVADVLARRRLREGEVAVALVHEPSLAQHVEQVVHLEPAQWRGLNGYQRSKLLAETVARLPIPPWRPDKGPQHSITTIVARRGLAVIGPREAEWLIAWRYSNHLANAYSGELVLLTEHGWTDFMTGRGGWEPRLTQPRAAGSARRRRPC